LYHWTAGSGLPVAVAVNVVEPFRSIGAFCGEAIAAGATSFWFTVIVEVPDTLIEMLPDG